MFFAEQEVKPAELLRDNDGKFGPQFDAVFVAEGVVVKRITPASPNLKRIAQALQPQSGLTRAGT